MGELFCFRNVLESKNIWITSYHDFVQFFLSHIAKNHRGRNLLCFRNLLVSKFWIIGVSRYHDSVDFFDSQCQKFCIETSNDSNKMGRPKNLCIVGEFHDFTLINFSLTKSKNFVGERFGVSKDLG